MSKLPCLKRANHFWDDLSATVFSVDGANVSSGPCSFGGWIELVKKNMSEMFIFLNSTLHSFGPENFVPLVQTGKFQKSLIEKNESHKMVHYKNHHEIRLGKCRLRQKPHELMQQPNNVKCNEGYVIARIAAGNLKME
jgi:hypothetical protein